VRTPQQSRATPAVSRLLFQETTKVEGIHPKVAGTEHDDISATEVDISSPPKDVQDTPHLNQEETTTIKETVLQA
jgi:hypothetical protein